MEYKLASMMESQALIQTMVYVTWMIGLLEVGKVKLLCALIAGSRPLDHHWNRPRVLVRISAAIYGNEPGSGGTLRTDLQAAAITALGIIQ
jgi:hypothetical protein